MRKSIVRNYVRVRNGSTPATMFICTTWFCIALRSWSRKYLFIYTILFPQTRTGIGGSVVECSPATRAARVRFPADANVLFFFHLQIN